MQAYKEGRGASLSVLMTASTYNLCFITGNDLGNAIYGQWLKHILTEDQWSRMFGGVSAVNEERAGDAVEVCLAMLFFATLYPHKFKMWGDPYENHAGIEHSLRSFAMTTGFIPTTGTQRGGMAAELSDEVKDLAKQFSVVMGSHC